MDKVRKTVKATAGHQPPMVITRRKLLAATGASAAVAGCLGGVTDGGSDGGSESGTVRVRNHDDFGDILVNSGGMTLYRFDSDEQGSSQSACTGGCVDAWPPLTVEDEPSVGDGVTATLSTFERDDGTTQVAADGWPLYYFASDESPGDTKGQGVNEVWWVVAPDGSKITAAEDGGYDPY